MDKEKCNTNTEHSDLGRELRAVSDPLSQAAIKQSKTPKEILKTWDVNIKFLDHGMVIQVGCRSFAFSDIENGMNELRAYTEDPQFYVDKYNNN